jgi:hypothetical protein
MNTKNIDSLSSSSRWAPIAGIAFAVLFIAGMFTMIQPESSTEQAINEFYADSGNRATLLIGAYLIALAGFAFLWFLGSVRQTVRRLAPDRPELSDVLLGGGIVFVAMMYAGAAAIGTGAAAMLLGGEEQFSHEVLRMLPQLGYGLLLLGGGFGAIAMVLSTSVALRRAETIPGWLSIYGMVTAILLLASVAYVPMVFFPIWAITISVVLLRNASRLSETIREVPGVAAQVR